MQERPVRFHLFGLEYTFYSDAPDEEVDAVIALLREELENGMPTGRSTVPSSKMLILGCLRMTARYEQLRRQHAATREQQRQQEDQRHSTMERLIHKISAELG